MAIALVQDFPGGTAELYDALLADLRAHGVDSTGLIAHAAGPFSGGWRIIDFWESQAAYDTFEREHLGPARERVLAAMNIMPPSPLHRPKRWKSITSSPSHVPPKGFLPR